MGQGKTKELDADYFDTLELMALAFGGIRSGPLFKGRTPYDQDFNCPVCAHGLALASDGVVPSTPGAGRFMGYNVISRALEGLGVDGIESDRVVRIINIKKGKRGGAVHDPVTYKEWCRGTGIVRKTAA